MVIFSTDSAINCNVFHYMHILHPWDMALLGEAESMPTPHPDPRELVLGRCQLAAAYILTQKVNGSKESCECPTENNYFAHNLLKSCLGTVFQRVFF